MSSSTTTTTTSPPFVATLLYPVPPPNMKPFDITYYINTHMTIAQKYWSPRGLRNWEVVALDPKSGYEYQCVLCWGSKGEYEDAMNVQKETSEKVTDVGNYSWGVKPVIVAGVVVGSQS